MIIKALTLLMFIFSISVVAEGAPLKVSWDVSGENGVLLSGVAIDNQEIERSSFISVLVAPLEPVEFGAGIVLNITQPYDSKGSKCSEEYRDDYIWLNDDRIKVLAYCKKESGSFATTTYLTGSTSGIQKILEVINQSEGDVTFESQLLSFKIPTKMLKSNWRKKFDSTKNMALFNLGWTQEDNAFSWYSVILDKNFASRVVMLRYVYDKEFEGLAFIIDVNDGDVCSEREELVIMDVDETPIRFNRSCSKRFNRYIYQFDTAKGEKYFVKLLLNKKAPIELKSNFKVYIPTESFGKLYSRYKQAL